MKKLFLLLNITIGLLIGINFVKAADNNKISPKRMESIRNRLLKEYNALSMIKKSDWNQNIIQAADIFRSNGKEDQAVALESMSDPEMKDIVLDLLKDKIDHYSENGIYAIIAALSKEVDDSHPGDDPDYDDDGDVVTSTGWYWFMVIITLGENSSASEI